MDVSKINPDGTTYDCKDATARADIATLQAQNVYITEEVDTGKKWTDGKTIYRVFLYVGNPNWSNTEGWVNITPSVASLNIETVLKAMSFATSNATGYRYTVHHYAVELRDNYIKARLPITLGSPLNASTMIEYTKAT